MAETRPTWTDERLDDLSHRVDDGFNRVDGQFGRVDQQFARVDARFDRIDARIDGMQRTMIQVGGGMIVTMIVGFAGVIATQ
jgi:archaellum component FlaC